MHTTHTTVSVVIETGGHEAHATRVYHQYENGTIINILSRVLVHVHNCANVNEIIWVDMDKMDQRRSTTEHAKAHVHILELGDLLSV